MQASTHFEKIISGIGGAIAIGAVFWLTRLGGMEMGAKALFVASFGATAVLLFAAPHSPLAHPWNVIGGHGVSALIGVVMHHLIADPVLGGALTAGLAITAMYYLRALHPPGGATSLIPLIGGAAADDYGWLFVLFPVLAGAVLIVLIATAFNWPFAWRRYPQALMKRVRIRRDPACPYPDITHADFVAALSQLDTYVDISEEDLLRIYELACKRRHPALEK